MKCLKSDQRLGLGLSGGGLRASFFHIGVLARMAELGILRHVESISAVSGGAIVAAAYYLLLKQLLERKADSEINDQDYIAIVQQLEQHFLHATQRNLRMMTFANPFKNLMMLRPDYSRADAIGELYETYLYRPLIEVGPRPIQMSDLLIRPPGAGSDFHPWHESVGNPSRRCKIPVLILNATSLNSGHNWVFTATSMGEVPPRNQIFHDIDRKDRYRRVRYDEITTRSPDFPLGKAVAASSGVPGLFPPMSVSNLYSDRRVQLVDGGVFDNQGIAGLLDPDNLCSDFIVSDAAGQSDAVDNPDPAIFPVLQQVVGIMGGRVREEMVNSLELNHPDRVAYFHLTRGLSAQIINIDQVERRALSETKNNAGQQVGETGFDVNQSAQQALAHIRTDLDSFTGVEAGALQADGFQVSKSGLSKMTRYLSPEPSQGDWQFRAYLPGLQAGDARLVKQLDLGRHQFFKPWIYVCSGACGVGTALLLLLVSLPLLISVAAIGWLIDWGLIGYLDFDWWQTVSNQQRFQDFMWRVAPAIYLGIFSLVLAKVADLTIRGSGTVARWIQTLLKGPMALISGIIVRALLPLIFALPVYIYLHTVDRFFTRVMGRID